MVKLTTAYYGRPSPRRCRAASGSYGVANFTPEDGTRFTIHDAHKPAHSLPPDFPTLGNELEFESTEERPFRVEFVEDFHDRSGVTLRRPRLAPRTECRRRISGCCRRWSK